MDSHRCQHYVLGGVNQIPETIADQLKHFDEFGGPHSAITPLLG